ncbi:unnamed protein product [Prorocentrum cordatum]|uniref:EF-hand domain-containing protein n=1 Tax=Prorocentrum cordatum TaxID=2364126 RepID=A0ABN9R6X2_9DINO|nr:unnamed protein product [Polarella glacialis]
MPPALPEIEGALARLERLQRAWGDPSDDQSAFRRGLRAELRAHALARDALGACHSDPAGGGGRCCAAGAGCADARSPQPDLPVAGEGWRRHGSSCLDHSASGDGTCSTGEDSCSPRSPSRAYRVGPQEPPDSSGLNHDRDGIDDSHAVDDDTRSEIEVSRPSKRKHTMTKSPTMELAMSMEIDVPWSVGSIRHTAWKLVHGGHGFDAVMGMVIVASAISVGLEIQWDIQGREDLTSVLHALQHVYLVIFVIELLIRAVADGKIIVRNQWFQFDAVVVATGVVTSWICAPIMEFAGTDQSFLGIFSKLLIVRTLRLLRLVRAFRLMEEFQDIWKLVSGLGSSLRTVLSAALLIVLAIYVFACAGVELITRNDTLLQDPETASVVENHFRTVQLTMLTLFRFTNADSISSIYTPLVSKAWYLAFYFGALWLTVTVSLMTSVAAVIVDNAIARGGQDRDMRTHCLRKKLKALTPYINSIFSQLDLDGDGVLQLSEVMAGLERFEGLETLPDDLQKLLVSDNLVDLYEFLDSDGSGMVDREEFFDGVCHLALESVPIETTQTLQLLRSQHRALELIRDVTCLQGNQAVLAADHPQGAETLSVMVVPKFRIRRDEDSVGAVTIKPKVFSIPLESPLETPCAVNSGISMSVHPEL